MLRLKGPSKYKREFLLVYGHHSSLERLHGLAELLAQYGNVTMPDIPGFGGMDPFYKIGLEPNVDTFADYLAAFIKLRYKRRKVVLVGFSYSVPVMVRMLQKYPDVVKQAEFMISISGFVHHEDFQLPPLYRNSLKIGALIFSRKIPSYFMKYVLLNPLIIRMTYNLMSNRHWKIKDADEKERKARIDYEQVLWKINDPRTWITTTGEMFMLDLCSDRVELPLHHVVPPIDVYFNHNVVEQHMRVIFSEVTSYETNMPNHAPSVLATVEDMRPMFPEEVARMLRGDK